MNARRALPLTALALVAQLALAGCGIRPTAVPVDAGAPASRTACPSPVQVPNAPSSPRRAAPAPAPSVTPGASAPGSAPGSARATGGASAAPSVTAPAAKSPSALFSASASPSHCP
ncbi:hypothetical protein [Kitasatospora cinereorecta]|uniref:Lipoprotein n=1 Tax=Kitasatospora cinereorecta TaxID=285560 RepID=A0ABW0VMH0_9ACTN